MRKLIFGLGLLFAVTTWAALSEVDKAQLNSTRLDINGGFENGKAGWVASGGTFLPVSSGSNLLFGLGSATWDSSAASQTLKSKLVAIPEGLKGKNGIVRCTVKVPSGTATHKIEATDGTNVLTSINISSSSISSKNTANFVFPSSGSVQLQLKSVASDEPLIALDICELGEADNVGTISQVSLIGSGYFAATTNCLWDVASASYSDFTSDADCPGPTLELNQYGYIQTTDSNLPQFTLNNMPPGDYLIYIDGGVGSNGTGANYVGLQLSDGTTSSGAHEFYINNSDIFPFSLVATFSYATQANRTFKLQGKKAGATTLRLSSGNAWVGPRFVIKKLPSSAEQIYRPDVVAWRVDANIGGANPSLGIIDVSSYTGIENGSLTMTQNTGSLDVQVPCSSTNASSGLTCSAGSESVGVVFNLPKAGSALACASFTHNPATGAGGSLNSTFQIVETPNNAQTISQEGKSRIESALYNASINQSNPLRVCGTFYFASAGQKTLRLMYEQDVTGTITASVLLADAAAAAGQRDIHWEVYPIDQQIPAPLLVNSLSSQYEGSQRLESATINCDASSSITSQAGSWISSIGNRATGCTLTITTGVFSGAPRCWGVPKIATSPGVNIGQDSSNTATSVIFYGRNAADSANQDFDADIFCLGPK